jgi:hypothetical protein
MTIDTSHFAALHSRVARMRADLAGRTMSREENRLRRVWLAQSEKELAGEYEFLCETECTGALRELTIEELAKELEGI